MRDRLEKMSESFSEKDMEKLGHGFDKIDKSADITSAQQQRIMSSVMRKAGIEMNDKRTRDNIKVSRGFKGFGAVAAAAAVLIVGVSAVTFAGRIKDEPSSLKAAQAVNDSSNAIGKADEQTVVFTSIDGKTLKIGKNTYEGSEYADRESVKLFDSGEEDDRTVVMTLVFTNGERQDICVRDITDKSYGHLEFAHFDIDPTSVSSVVINGTVYSQDNDEDDYRGTVQWDYESKGDSITNEYVLTQHFKLTKYLTYTQHGTLELGFLAEALDDEGSEIIANNRDKLLVYLGVTDKKGNTYCLSDDTIEMTDDSNGRTYACEYISIPSYKETLKDYDMSSIEAVWFTLTPELDEKLVKMNRNDYPLDDEEDKDSILGKVTFSLDDVDDADNKDTAKDTGNAGFEFPDAVTFDYGDDLCVALGMKTQNETAAKLIDDNRSNIGVYIRTYKKDGTAESATFKKGESFTYKTDDDGSTLVSTQLTIKEYKEALKDLDPDRFEAVWFIWDDSMAEDEYTLLDPYWTDKEQFKDSVLGTVEFSVSSVTGGKVFTAGDDNNVTLKVDRADGTVFSTDGIKRLFAENDSQKTVMSITFEDGSVQDITVKDVDMADLGYISFSSLRIDYIKAVSLKINGTVYKPMV